ncbi:MAG TPA: glutathione S-transferase N-terminal domain-containing protein [Patescibacteria group bacterium]|nr:glutathione S-transferase N-terminal domain-containing protein [Patescibacteria group bacterium]
MGTDLILYVGEKNISSWSMRGWLAVTHKGVPFEERTIPLKEDKDRSRRRKVSPTGRLPVLHHGSIVVPDSLAIVEYLEETFPAPAHPALWPADRGARAHARWLAAAMHSGFMKLREGMSFNTCFLPKRKPAGAEALAEAAEMLALFEDALRGGTGPFLFGSYGGVDAIYAPAIVRLVAYEVPTASTPKAAAYLRAVLAHEPVSRWLDAARALPPAETY